MECGIGRPGKTVGVAKGNRRLHLNVDRRIKIGQQVDQDIGSHVVAEIWHLSIPMPAVATMHKGVTRVVAGSLIRRDR